MTERSHAPTTGTGSCKRRQSSAFTSPSFACNLFRTVCRTTVNRPFRVVPQMCVKPRKLNVSGFPKPARRRFSAAEAPNSSSRVFSRVQLQVELCESLAQFRQEPLGIRSVFKPHEEVIRVPD